MQEATDLQTYITRGVSAIVGDALRATLRDPRQSAFFLRFSKAAGEASRRRAVAEKEGLHVPAFLIASITSACNLHCAGCYSRSNRATVDCRPAAQLTDADWTRLFREADGMGISFILLAGGEPLLRRGVVEAAGEIPNILFPIFTNGTCMDGRYLELFENRRNLLPVLSIEGGREQTDARRGAGIYDRLMSNMDRLHERDLLFGASVTVTKDNLAAVTSDAFLDTLSDRGCKAVFYVEYVPVTPGSAGLAFGEAERAILARETGRLRADREGMIFLSFPGDENLSDGCLAAGRGFFHINSHGGAEPCPFSPYSDVNIRDGSLRDALASPLFAALRDSHLLEGDHDGGCVLFGHREQVEKLAGAVKNGT